MENGGGTSNQLREFLRQRQEDHNEDCRNLVAGETLRSVLNAEKTAYPTLLDIIQEDSRKDNNNKKNWKNIKDKLRLCRNSDVVMNNSTHNCMIFRRLSSPMAEAEHPAENLVYNSGSAVRNNEVRSPENVTTVTELPETADGGEEAPARMSLMALLSDSDYMISDDDDEEEEEEEDGGGGGGEAESGGTSAGECNHCCVCMVRAKGSAFIPCGHTFCRLCSRQLWVKRGHCPLCNGQISEILDIF